MSLGMFRVIVGAVTLVVTLGLMCIISVTYWGASERPWEPLGIILVGFGAIGAGTCTLIMAVHIDAESGSRRGRREP